MNKRSVGTGCEELAGAYLSSKGVRIKERNFRVRQGEIDLIGYDGNTLVFFEVKYRKNADKGLPQEAVDFRKQAQIVKVAAYYRNRYRIPEDAPQRFDVIAILGNEIEWIKNAFDGIL